MQLCPPLLVLLISRLTPVLGLKDVTIKSFSDLSHVCISVSNPAMGGQSNATFAVSPGDGGAGVFEGEVKDVPSIGPLGFIAV